MFQILASVFTLLNGQLRPLKGFEEVTDIKDFKKLLRTKNNVLVLFTNTLRSQDATIRTFKEASSVVRGQGTMVLIDCSG